MTRRPRSRAEVVHPGVALTLVTPAYGTLVYTCDALESHYHHQGPSWQANLHAVALALHDLRRLDRYGIADRGQQYAGFRELGSGTVVAGELRSRQDVADWLADQAGLAHLDPDDEATVNIAYRLASKRCHPDVAGGSAAAQQYVNAARDHLLGT